MMFQKLLVSLFLQWYHGKDKLAQLGLLVALSSCQLFVRIRFLQWNFFEIKNMIYTHTLSISNDASCISSAGVQSLPVFEQRMSTMSKYVKFLNGWFVVRLKVAYTTFGWVDIYEFPPKWLLRIDWVSDDFFNNSRSKILKLTGVHGGNNTTKQLKAYISRKCLQRA